MVSRKLPLGLLALPRWARTSPFVSMPRMPVPSQIQVRSGKSGLEVAINENSAPLMGSKSDTLFSCSKRRTDGKMG